MPVTAATRTGRHGPALAAILALGGLSACRREQSALHPASQDAADIADLFWAMTIGGALIWAVVFGIAVYAVVGRRRPKTEYFADRFILVGGVFFPTLVLAALLVFGLRLLPDWREDAPADLRVHVTGEQFWWRLRYEQGDDSFETANRLVLPQGALVEFALSAEDVIHSFWIPPLGGKLDMIPGRTNLLRLRPAQTGTYRGVCAEFCGLSHALMAFEVEIVPPDEFALWLAAEGADAVGSGSDPNSGSGSGSGSGPGSGSGSGKDPGSATGAGGGQLAPAGPAPGPAMAATPDAASQADASAAPAGLLAAGAEAFRQAGCGACHQVRGLIAEGAVGPDLTHLAARNWLAAGSLPMSRESLARWLAAPQAVKPGARMPAYGDLPPGELEKIVSFLMELR